MNCSSKDLIKNAPCLNTHHDVIDLVNHGMVKNTKTNISRTEHNFSMKQRNSELASQMANFEKLLLCSGGNH